MMSRFPSRVLRMVAPVLLALALVSTGALAFASELRIAVAANFAAPAEAVARAFTEKTGIAVSVSTGSTGALFAQITQGAPFSVFLSADSARPQQLEYQGFGVAGSRFTYALGQLVLWSRDPDLITGNGSVLRSGSYTHLAIANPETAPYGAAAMEVLTSLGAVHAVGDRLVTGQSVAQAFSFVESGNAELGFVALSQVEQAGEGSRWLVPKSLYTPIRQDAILLDADNDQARVFMDFLKSTQVREIIARFGYSLAE